MADAMEIIATAIRDGNKQALPPDAIAMLIDGRLHSAGYRILGPDEAAQVAELEAERDLLQDILDSRPAINAGLPDSYIRWSQAIYSGDAVRAIGRKA